MLACDEMERRWARGSGGDTHILPCSELFRGARCNTREIYCGQRNRLGVQPSALCHTRRIILLARGGEKM